MAEDQRLESKFMWGLAAALAFLTVFMWGIYLIGPDTWHASWAAFPFTLGTIGVAIAAYRMGRRPDSTRLRR